MVVGVECQVHSFYRSRHGEIYVRYLWATPAHAAAIGMTESGWWYGSSLAPGPVVDLEAPPHFIRGESETVLG